MVKSKKLLSLFLAVVMVLSVFTVMASAYTRGEAEGTADVDIKYTVEKVGELPETDAGSVALAGDNFYAVTVWMKSAKPIDTFTAAFHYNKAHFSPVTLTDGEVTYPVGAGMDQDSYYSEMGEGAVYAYTLGDYMNNTGMYRENGTTAATKALAKCIGLGNANSEGVAVRTELVSPDHPLYSSQWGVDLPADTGVLYANLDVATNAKTAYLNTLEGVNTYTDWVNMFTVYFETITDESVVGDEFGVFMDTEEVIVDACYDANGKGYYESAAAYKGTRATVNVVSNAVVEESAPAYSETTPTIISNLKTQMRFNPKNSANLDVRNLAVIDGAALNAYLNDAELLANYTATATQTQQEQLAADLIKDIGFIYSASTETTIDRDDAILWHQGLESTQTYAKKPVSFIDTSTSSGNYVISCMVDNINADDCQTYHLVSLGYLVLDTDFDGTADTYYYYDTVNSTDLAKLYGNRPA